MNTKKLFGVLLLCILGIALVGCEYFFGEGFWDGNVEEKPPIPINNNNLYEINFFNNTEFYVIVFCMGRQFDIAPYSDRNEIFDSPANAADVWGYTDGYEFTAVKEDNYYFAIYITGWPE